MGDPRSDDVQTTELALAAGAGDRAALTAFIRITQRDVYRFVCHLCARDEAEDLTQETYLRALRALPGFAGRSSARTWLLSIARRVAADQIRRSMARPRTTAVDDWDAVAAGSSTHRRPASTRASCCVNWWPVWNPTAGTPLYSPKYWVWATPPPRCADAPSAPSAPGWPVLARTWSARSTPPDCPAPEFL